MLDRALLSPEAIAYFNALPLMLRLRWKRATPVFAPWTISRLPAADVSQRKRCALQAASEPAILQRGLGPAGRRLKQVEGAADRQRLLHSWDLVMGPHARHTQRLTFHVFSHIMERNLFALHYIPVLPGCEITQYKLSAGDARKRAWAT